MSETTTIFHYDDYKIFDKLSTGSDNKNGVRGWVQVYLNAKHDDKNNLISGDLVYENNNLVVAQGRAFVAQKIFNVAGSTDFRAFNISHFAVGSGGATVDGNHNVTLLGPYICDNALYSPIKLSSTYLNEPSNIVGSPDTIFNYQGAVKPITTDGLIQIESEDYSGGATSCSFGTKVKCTCVVPAGEPSGLNPGQSVPINEAGLYFTSGTSAKMFAHICFPVKFKEYESSLSIIWYILC